MNLSQRSILFSLVLHGSLFLSGLFLYIQLQNQPVSGNESEQEESRITVRPVRLANLPKPTVKPSEPSPLSNKGPAPPPLPIEPSPIPEPTAAPTNSPGPKVPQLAPAYPTARLTPGPTQGEPSKPGSSGRGTGRRTVPLWTPPIPVATPTPTQTQTPSPAPAPSGKAGPSRPSRPLFVPQILLAEKFPQVTSASVTVKFVIRTDGTFEVTMTRGTGNLDADLYILESLRSQARWSPRMESGEPVEDLRTVDLDIER